MTIESNPEAIAAQADQLYKQGLEFYEQRDFEAALTAWQQTIELGKQLPLDNPQYRNALAGAYFSCGSALDNLGRFEEAIAQYQQAIKLEKSLPLDNPEYRNNLVGAYFSCGSALDNLGRFEEAIVQYQQAIKLLKQLPLDNPEYCDNLALAYNNCGLAFADLRRFEEAIAQYQQAIKLGKQLPLDNPEYCNNLAIAYSNCGLAFADLRRFEEAIVQYQQAIKLLKQLPLDNPEYRNVLAGAYSSCGSALDNLGRFEEAIAQYQQAIKLGKSLPLDDPEYRNDLALAYDNCGLAFADLRRFEEAIAQYQQAIKLLKQLPLDNPEYRSNLAGAYFSCGSALDNLGRFEEAIAQYQQAIKLLKQLPLDNPEYRNVLAGAYSSCGSALDNLGRFEEAIVQYQQAIKLLKQLPLDNPEYRNDLAWAYNNCGNALGELRRFEEAIAQYQQAIELRKQLPLDNPKYRNDLAGAYFSYGSALYSLGCFAEAEDAIEESLKIRRKLEQQGIHWFREAREVVFGIAIGIYLSGAFRFLPKLILEHLDPVNDGAAPQSERMHQAALKGLLQLYQRVYYTHPKLLPEIEQTVLRLAEIRAKYFTGTATGAKLTAQFYEENVQDLVKARQILEHYTQQVTDDPEGYVQLAEFYVRRQNFQTALHTYQVALQKILLQPLDAAQQHSVVAVLQTLYLLIAQPSAWQTEKQVDASINKIHEWYTDWLLTLPESLRPTIKMLHAHALQAIEAQRESWRERDKALQLSEFRKQAEQQFKVQLTISFQAIRVLPATLQKLVATLLNAQQELWQESTPSDEGTMNDKIETLQNTLERMLSELPEAELDEAGKLLEQEWGVLWTQLLPEEQRFLKLGMRLYQDRIYVFAATSFGCAVETSLKARLFQPVKQFLQQNQTPVDHLSEEDFIAHFFDGKANLMLGNLVGGFNQTFHDGKPVTHQTNVHYLKQCLPHYQPDSATKQRRGEQLNSLRRIRNQIHTESQGSPKEAAKMLDIIYNNQQDGFYRYLLGA